MAKRRIAILGGGVGSITAAWALTSLPGWSDRFEITLYQMGWRLGGKGASGRNARYGQRIEEHGLHIWMGFYDNAFRALQQCYDELNRPPDCPIRTWTDAFHPHNDIVLYEFVKGRWRSWPITVPMRAGEPGADREPHEVTKLFEELLEWLAGVICGPAHEPALVAMFDAWRTAGRPGWLAAEWAHVSAFVETRLSRMAQFTGAGHETDHLAWLLEDLHAARRAASAVAAHVDSDHEKIVEHLERFLDRFRALARDIIEAHEDARRLFVLVELAVIVARGIIRDGVLQKGFDAIAGIDFRDWLRRHGATDEIRGSATVRTMYSLCFAFEEGPRSPQHGRGRFPAHDRLMGFSYRGAFMYTSLMRGWATSCSVRLPGLEGARGALRILPSRAVAGPLAGCGGDRSHPCRSPGAAQARPDQVRSSRHGEGPAVLAEHARLQSDRGRRSAARLWREPGVGLVHLARRRHARARTRPRFRRRRAGNFAWRPSGDVRGASRGASRVAANV